MKTISDIIKAFFILMFLGYIMLLVAGCAKNATETATDASLAQLDAIEQQIKKDCPTVNYDKQINALRANINTQLVTCETQKDVLKSKNTTLFVIIGGLLATIALLVWNKIKRILK